METATFLRPTVLVVEDEIIIALDLSETIRELGYGLEGPFADKRNAFIAIGQHMPDCAILDIHTGDGEVYPLADALTKAGVPIIFHSGHVTSEEVTRRYPKAFACAKPSRHDHLVRLLRDAIGEEPALHH